MLMRHANESPVSPHLINVIYLFVLWSESVFGMFPQYQLENGSKGVSLKFFEGEIYRPSRSDRYLTKPPVTQGEIPR